MPCETKHPVSKSLSVTAPFYESILHVSVERHTAPGIVEEPAFVMVGHGSSSLHGSLWKTAQHAMLHERLLMSWMTKLIVYVRCERSPLCKYVIYMVFPFPPRPL